MGQFQFSGKKFQVEAAGRTWTFTPRPGAWVIAESKNAQGTLLRQRIMVSRQGEQVSIFLMGKTYTGKYQEVIHSASSNEETEGGLAAQFPGKVRQIFVKSGEKVKKGQVLLKVEAMKMEFEIKAPQAGEVKQVRVKEEQQVLPGDSYVDFESGEESQS